MHVVFQDRRGPLTRAAERPNLLLPGTNDSLIDYSDSEAVESYIHDVICRADDVSAGSAELMRHIRDWATLYHFHADRVNLLRPLDHHLKGAVLEVGAGCGALSVYVAERAERHVALEGAPMRARVCAARCRHHPGTTVCAVNIQDFDTNLRFDTVLLVGVLEYSRLYISGGDSAFSALLDKVTSLLKPDGVLVLAIENRLGLKYFAGAPEDHAGTAFVGIEDTYEANSFKTFGRAELTALLKASGYTQLEWRFPFPDYKLPKLIVHEAALRDRRIPVGDLVAAYPAGDQGQPYSRLFQEALAWEPVVENGLLPDMANSFLVVAASSRGALPTGTGLTDLVSVYSTDRCPEFRKQTVLSATDGGTIQVQRSRLAPVGEQGRAAPDLRQELKEEDFIDGVPYLRGLMSLARRTVDPAVAIPEWSRPWIELLEKAATRTEAGCILPGDYVDCIPGNLILTADGPRYFDREWVVEDGLELPYVAFRGLYWSLYRVRTIARWPSVAGRPIAAVTAEILGSLGIVVDPEAMMEREMNFQVHANGGPADGYRTFLRTSSFTSVESPEARLGRLQREMRELSDRYRDLQKAHEHLSQATAECLGAAHRAPRCIGYVDAVVPSHDGGRMLLGWAIDTATMKAVRHLVLMVGDVPVASAAPFVERPDVMRQMGSTDTLAAGFAIHVPTACTVNLDASTARVLAFSDVYIGDLTWP